MGMYPEGRSETTMSNDFVPARLRDLQGPRPHEFLAAGFLAAYREPTRTNYTANLKRYFAWCDKRGLNPVEAERAHIELYARQMEEVDGLMLSTVAGQIGTLNRYYHFAVVDRYLPHNPCEFVRRPTVQRVSTTNSLSRPELLTLLELAQKAGGRDHALMCIGGLNGLRVGEVVALNVEDMARVGGYVTLKVKREKHGETPVIPLSPRTSWAFETATFGRTHGPVFLTREGTRMDKPGANRVLKRLAKQAGFAKRLSYHSLRHTFITLALDAGVSVRDVQNSVGHQDPRQVSYYDRHKQSLPRNATHLLSAYVEGA